MCFTKAGSLRYSSSSPSSTMGLSCMENSFWVRTSSSRPPAFETSAEVMSLGVAALSAPSRVAMLVPPASLSTSPPLARPWPRVTATTRSAMPGSTRAGADTLRPPAAMRSRSPSLTLSSFAVAGEMAAALSQTSLDTGSGSSCSQALLANRPSWSAW